MKTIFVDEQKRYKFEDKDLKAQKEFEKSITGVDEISDLLFDLVKRLTQSKAEGWREMTKFVKEIDPEFDDERHNLSYDALRGEFRIMLKGTPKDR
jgi:hypothetical protein